MTHPLPQHIDSTMMSCFRACPQKYWLEFAQGYRPRGVSIDLHAGGCFATAMETTYRAIHLEGKSVSDALMIAHGAFIRAWGNFIIPEHKRTAKTFDRVWEAVEDYFNVYPPLTDHVQPYFASNGAPTFEYTFCIPLDFDGFPLHPSGEPFLYTGRFDMLGSYNGRPCVRDEKTSGASPDVNWSEKWDLRSQFMGYVWACRQMGIDLDTVVVRGIGILKTKIAHAEAIKVYSSFMIDRWFEQLRRDVIRLRACYDEGYFDFNLGDSCTSFGNCIFNPVCQSPTPESWLSNFEVSFWNPLNKNPIEPTT